MITCIIRYELTHWGKGHFETYARNWAKLIPECGANYIGYFSPHEGSKTQAYGLYSLASLSDYERYRAKLSDHPLGAENYDFAQRERFIIKEERAFFHRIA